MAVRNYIAHAAIAALAADGKMTGKDVARAIKQYKRDSLRIDLVIHRLFEAYRNLDLLGSPS